VLSELDARSAANHWLKTSNIAVAMKTQRVAQTHRSWIFEVVAVNGEILFGNAPLVVNKATGEVLPCKDGWREFSDQLGIMDRVLRWWHRLGTY
jgi:hypothetical protein